MGSKGVVWVYVGAFLWCECLCYCMLAPRSSFFVSVFAYFSVHTLYTLYAWCVTLRVFAIWQMARPPVKTYREKGEQGTDVFQVEKRQQNLYKALSKGPLLSLCWSIIEWASVYGQSRSMKTLTNKHALCFLGHWLYLCLINMNFHLSSCQLWV